MAISSLLTLFMSLSASADLEPLNQAKLKDYLLQPSFTVEEQNMSRTNVDGYLEAQALVDTWLEGVVSVGTESLTGRPSWMPASGQQLSFLNLYISAHNYIGKIFAGQTRTPWGLEGSSPERDLWFPRSLIFEKGVFPIFDRGIGAESKLENLYMTYFLHSGEGAGATASDNRVFVTGQWGYKGPVHSRMGASATSGRHLMGNQETKLRGGNVFFGFHVSGLGLQIEGSYFKSTTQNVDTDIYGWHLDAQHPVSDQLDLQGRFEQFNPVANRSGQVQGRGYFGLSWHSVNQASRLFFHFIKNYEGNAEINNDGVLVTWRLNPPVGD